MPVTTTGKATEFINFSRASNATVVASDGKVKWAPHNLLLASEQFDASSWTKGAQVTLTANAAAAPNGTTTAEKYSTSDGADSSLNNVLQQVATGPATLTAGVWLRAATNQTVTFTLLDNTTVITSQTLSVTSTWTLFTITGTVTTGTATLWRIRPNGTTAISNLEIWGAHLYRSDLGGMVANTSAYPMYNPTTAKNLLGYSEDFSNVAWQGLYSGVTVSNNTSVAPSGLQAADTITLTSTAYAYQALTTGTVTGKTLTFSAWLWSESGKGTIVLRLSAFTTGTDQAKSVITLTSTPTRYSVTRTFTSADTQITFGIDNRASQGADGLAGSIVMWGAQLSDSASLDTYTRNNFAAPSAAAYYGPRLDYDPSTLAAKGLLVEEQRTNLLTYSNTFDNAAWSKSTCSVTPASGISPDGTNNAYLVTSGGLYPALAQAQSGTGNGTFSYFVKDGTSGQAIIRITGTDVGGAGNTQSVYRFTFSNATLAYVSGGTGTASAQSVGNGWYRISLTVSSTTFTAGVIYPRFNDATAATILVYGAQLEAGSFATSYIPTTSASVTRSADVAQVGLSAIPYGPEVTVVAKVLTSVPQSANKKQIWMGDSIVSLAVDTTVVEGGIPNVQTIATVPATYTPGTPFKAGFAFSDGNSVVAFNGTVGSAGTGSPAELQTGAARIGANYVAATQTLNGCIQQITVIPRRLTNAELQSRTA